MALNDIKVPRENASGTFDEITLPDATTSARGLLTSADKTKLDGIATGATANTASTSTPSALGTAAAGTSSNFARADHVHAVPNASALLSTGAGEGDLPVAQGDGTIAWQNGTTWAGLNITASDVGAAAATHASAHASGGSDPLAPSDIGAQSIFTTANASAPTGAALQLTAQRARIWTVTNTAVTGDADIQLPFTGIQTGDVAVIRGSDSSTANLTVKSPAQSGGTVLFYTNPQNTPSGNPVVISNASHQYRFIVNDPTSFVPWSFVAVDSHTHPASAISDSTTAGRALLTGADAAAQRTSLGLGTAATSASGDFAAASHSHGNINSSGQVGSDSGRVLVTTTAGAVTTLALGTAGQVLRTKSDLSGVEFADPAAAGVTSVTGTAPIVSSGGTTPAISVTVGTGANTVAAGNDSRITGAIQSSLVDAKGDLIVATAEDTVARLPVGATNCHVLTVD